MKLKKGKALAHFIKTVFDIETEHSQTTEKESELIAIYCKNKKLAVEIGVYEGVNTINIAKNIDDNGILYAIDPFFKGNLGLSYGKLLTIMSLKKNRLIHKVKILEMFS